MSWTNPRTWILGELVTETLLNTHLRDNLLFLKSNPVIASASVTDQVLSGINGTVNVIVLAAVAIPADVGAIYVEAWAPSLNTANHQSFSQNVAAVNLTETTAGAIAGASVYTNSNSVAVGAPVYMRTRDFAWAGTTRTVTFSVSGGNCEGQLQANTGSPAVLRIVRAY